MDQPSGVAARLQHASAEENRDQQVEIVGVSLAVAALSLGPAYSAETQQPSADNTKVNKRDQQPNQKTADQQKNNASDLETTRQIRKAITADDSLSTDAHNVKIITVDGQVTLKYQSTTPKRRPYFLKLSKLPARKM